MARGSYNKMLSQHAHGLARLACGLPPGQSRTINATLTRWGCYTSERTGVREYTLTLTEEGKRLLAEYEAHFGPVTGHGPRTFAPAVVSMPQPY